MSGFLSEQGQDQQRSMFLAMALALGIILVWQSFITPPPPPAPAVAEDGSGEVAPALADDVAPANPAVAGDPAAAIAVLPDFVIRGSNHDVRITNVGGRISGVQIRTPEQYVPRASIFGVFPDETETALPGGLALGGLPDLTDTSMFALVEDETTQNADGTYERVTLRWTSPDGAIRVTRSYAPDPRAFGLAMTVRVENTSAAERRFDGLVASVVGHYSTEKGGLLNRNVSVLEGICAGEFGTERKPGRKIDERRHFDGAVGFGGVDEQYFMNALVVGENTAVTSCALVPAPNNHVRTELATSAFSILPGSTETFDFVWFSGPKHEDYYSEFPGELGRAVDFGIFSFLAIPIRMMLLFFQSYVPNWGFAIILLTLAIKLVLFPVTQKGYTSMEKMKRVQPKLSELQKKYETDRQKLAEAQMKLFREEGVSPLSGCLPMLAQMPIYIALYRTIWGSAELYNAPFALWITDLSQPDPYFVLPILMGAVMLIQQRLMPQAVDNPQMKMVNRIMPIMFTAMMLFLPSGLVLYIFVNMLLSIFQMLYIRKRHATPEADAAA